MMIAIGTLIRGASSKMPWFGIDLAILRLLPAKEGK